MTGGRAGTVGSPRVMTEEGGSVTTLLRRHLVRLLVAAGAVSPLLSPACAGAAAGSAGTNFWLGFPAAEQAGSQQFVLELTATAKATGTVSVPGTAFSHPFSVKPGTTTGVTVPLSTEDMSNDAVASGQGIHVIANRNVSIDAMYLDSGLSDGYLGLPTPLLGKSYVVAAVPGNSACPGSSEFEIVGTQAATTVSITPQASIAAHTSGVPYTEQLAAGSAYLGQASGTDGLTGSLIVSNKSVAVFAGNNCGQVPVGTSFANALMEQETPVTAWGTAFFMLPFASRTAGDYYTIVASKAGTAVTSNGSPLVMIGSAGGSATETITSASHITSDKPILIEHLATGGEFDSNGDPTMIDVLPSSHYTRIQTVTTPAGFTNNYLNITIAKSDIHTLALDGKPVTASMFHLVGDSSTESGAALPVSPGAHTLVAAGPFGAEVYGFVPAPTSDAYGFPGTLGVPARAAAPLIKIKTPSNGAAYKKGQAVRASYACAAATGATIRSCAGPVGNGALTATSTVGTHTFTVKATDSYGDRSGRTITYHVVQR